MRARIADALFWLAWDLRPTFGSQGLSVTLRLRRFGLPLAILFALVQL